MKLFLKLFLQVVVTLGFCSTSIAQSIILDFANRKVSADGMKWTFDLMGKGDATYGGVQNGLWIAFNVRMDVALPAGVTILGGSGVGDPTYASASIGVQNMVPGFPPPGHRGLGLTLERSDSDQDLNTANFVKLASYTINFSAPVQQGFAVVPRPNPIISGSSWVNSSNENLERPFTFVSSEFPLPVKLIDFSAAREGNSATLSWSTSEETNSDRFDVERSWDGKTWENLKSVAAKGESTVVTHYNAVDDSPLTGNNLYRLKMIDKDGTSAFSKVRNVEFDIKNDYAFYPNPAEDLISLKSVGDWKQVSKIQIFNANGVEVYTSPFSPSKEISVKNLASGTYVVKVTRNNSQVSNYKVVIAR
jgi:hypothetical protein